MRIRHLSRAAFVGLILTFSGCGEGPLASPGDAIFNPRLEPAVIANATVLRPFEDFLNTQGTFCWPDNGGCLLFEPPAPNILAWADPATWYLAWADYTGLQNAWIESESGGEMSLGTVVTGTIKETALDDGRALIHMNLKAKNALFWLNHFVDFGTWDPMYFGARPQDVLDGAEPALGNINMMVEFINTAPGAPIPDFVQLYFFPEPEQEIVTLTMNSLAQGILHEASGYPEGTPGIAKLVEANLQKPPVDNNPNWDAWPVEKVWFSPQPGKLNR
jgi:hypothetical protein